MGFWKIYFAKFELKLFMKLPPNFKYKLLSKK